MGIKKNTGKRGMEMTFLKLVIVMFVVLLVMGALYRWFYKPGKATIDPLANKLENQASQLGNLGGGLDYDDDGVPDDVDVCCDCMKIGRENVAPTGDRPGCAPDQKEGTCPGPCGGII